jgi:hypothetical protein
MEIPIMERRKAQRYDLRLPFELVRWGRTPASIQGETRNVSSSGVLFRSDAQLGIGDPLEYVITLVAPPGHTTPVRLHCVGKVIRYTRDLEVAVTLERYEFVRENHAAPEAFLTLPLPQRVFR